MTVQEMIDELMTIENKDMTIFARVLEEYPARVIDIEEVHDGKLNYVLLI